MTTQSQHRKARARSYTTCARPGCKAKLPELAVKHGDEFCSADCARAAHGVVSKPRKRGSGVTA